LRFGHGELHLVLLALLSERAMHGYELMGELSRRIRRYTPSPGSIYPAIQALEAEGLIAATDDGDRRVYAVTAEGSDALTRRLDRLATLEARLGVRLLEGFEPLVARFVERVRAASIRADSGDIERILDRAATDIETLAKRGGRT
jgi:DNA-binding PadR family transcriptional regulator